MVGITRETVERDVVTLEDVGIASVVGTGGGPAPAADIQEFIDNLGAVHRWKCNDASGNLLDSGSGGALDMTPVGTLAYAQGGPDVSTESVDFNTSSDFARTTAGMSSAATGTVLAFIRNISNAVTVVANSNTVNETNTFTFGNNPQGTGTAFRIGASMFLVTLFNRRQWIGSTDTTAWSADNTWHLIGWVADGVGTMRINVDGVEDTVTEATLGTPPASSAWFGTIAEANSRGVLANARFGSGSSNNVGQQSECVVLDGIEMTTQQFVDLFALVTN